MAITQMRVQCKPRLAMACPVSASPILLPKAPETRTIPTPAEPCAVASAAMVSVDPPSSPARFIRGAGCVRDPEFSGHPPLLRQTKRCRW